MPKKRLTTFEKETRKAEAARDQPYFFEEMKPKPPRPVVKKAPWEPRGQQFNERRCSPGPDVFDEEFKKKMWKLCGLKGDPPPRTRPPKK